MVIWKEELHRGILYFVSPAFEFMLRVTAGTFKDIIDHKKKVGYDIHEVRQMDKALDKFVLYLKESGLETTAWQARIMGDIMLTMLDEEKEWTPIWFKKGLEIAREEGLI